MGVVASTILSVILTVLLMNSGIAYSEAISYFGNKQSKRLTELAKDIYTEIAKSGRNLEQWAEAWSQKDTNLMSELMQGAGFGPRSDAVKRAKKILREEYEGKRALENQRLTDLQNKYNEATTASYNTNSISGIQQAKQLGDTLDQFVNGGAPKEPENKRTGDTMKNNYV